MYIVLSCPHEDLVRTRIAVLLVLVAVSLIVGV
jgi:hypothetical protein